MTLSLLLLLLLRGPGLYPGIADTRRLPLNVSTNKASSLSTTTLSGPQRLLESLHGLNLLLATLEKERDAPFP